MRLKQLLYLALMIALASPMLADAQIYKWKDKNGVTRYSDTPPTDNVKVETIGKSKTTTPTPPAAKAPTKATEKPSKSVEKQPNPDEAARLRAEKAEQEKQKREQEAAQEKARAENCRGAKANYEAFAQGGRIYEMDEKGERVYFDDAGLNARKAQAEAEMRQYCN